MDDLFEREQMVLDHALAQLEAFEQGTPCAAGAYGALVKEYCKLLKQFRHITKISDKTTVGLNTSNLNLQDKVYFDALTGIYNRRFLDEKFQQILRALASGGRILSVLMIDVDFFKRFNDTYGHGAGDECLKQVARTVSRTLRGDDFVARYGGEEFVVVLSDTNEDGARAMADRVLAQIRACGIFHEKNEAADCVTVSIGITTGAVKSSQTMEDYIKIADKALYRSKTNGRNQSTFIKLEEELD